jgi:polar amino acid transport system substrate-binding protein
MVYSVALSTNSRESFDRDTVSIIIKFQDGSIGSIQYYSNGDTSYPKEYCEVFCEGSIAIMNNFTEVMFVRNGKIRKIKYDGKKGHKEEIHAFIHSLKNALDMPIPFEEIKYVTQTTFKIIQSLETSEPVFII